MLDKKVQISLIKSKANVLSPVIDRITAGQPYRHVLGFEAGEISRSRKDTLYNSQARTGWYPMQDWGVGRAEAIAYLKEVTGVEFARSACTRVGPGEYTVSWKDELQGSAKTNFSCVVGSEMYEDVEPGICTVGLLPDHHEIRLRTYDPSGKPADRPFHLAVFRD